MYQKVYGGDVRSIYSWRNYELILLIHSLLPTIFKNDHIWKYHGYSDESNNVYIMTFSYNGESKSHKNIIKSSSVVDIIEVILNSFKICDKEYILNFYKGIPVTTVPENWVYKKGKKLKYYTLDSRTMEMSIPKTKKAGDIIYNNVPLLNENHQLSVNHTVPNNLEDTQGEKTFQYTNILDGKKYKIPVPPSFNSGDNIKFLLPVNKTFKNLCNMKVTLPHNWVSRDDNSFEYVTPDGRIKKIYIPEGAEPGKPIYINVL